MERLRCLAGRRVSAAGVLTVGCQSSRDQSANRRACEERLSRLVTAALETPRERRPTRPTAASRRRRLEDKRRRAETKKGRLSGSGEAG